MVFGESNLVLIVEDEEDLLEILADEIGSTGFNVITATNGAEAYDSIISRRPALVISDVMMPDMNGFDLLSKIRFEHPELNMMPMMFLTALTDNENRSSALLLGVDDYITKPIDFEILIPMIWGRINQIKRISEFHDQQLAKIYKRLVGVSKETQSPAVSETSEPDAPRPKALMCAADLERYRDIGSVLKSAGYDVVECESGNGLLECLSAEQPRFVFLAHVTADVAGFYVANRIKQETGGGLPVILLGEIDCRIKESQLPKSFDDMIYGATASDDINRIEGRSRAS